MSLSVAPGEIVTLLGANGSGKSTTLRAISGLVRPAGGTIRWQGHDLGRLPADRIVISGIGHVPEGRDVFAEFTELENLLVGAHTVGSRDVPARLEAAYGPFPFSASGDANVPARCLVVNSRCSPSPAPS